jgi:hypothetical protein
MSVYANFGLQQRQTKLPLLLDSLKREYIGISTFCGDLI